MKIGIVCPYNMIKGGGVQEIVKAQARGLRARGHEVLIITPRPPEYAGDPPDKHMVFLGRSYDARAIGTTAQVSITSSKEADEFMKEHEFDVLNFHEPWVPSLGLYLLPRAKKAGIATVSTHHAKLPDDPLVVTVGRVLRPYAKSVIKYIDSFVAASIPGSEYISATTRHPVAFIPVDIDTTIYTFPESFDDDRPYKKILYVGRLESRKGAKYLIQAFAKLQVDHPDIQLDIIGRGPKRAMLEGMAKDLGAKNVNFLGFVENDEKIRRLREADLFCVPSLYGEGFGLVLLEGMAMGVPVVAGDNPGYASVMTGCGALSLINPRDIPDFARRLELMLYQKDLRAAWRKWAKAEVQQYDTMHMVDKYEKVYSDALAARHEKSLEPALL